MSCLPTYNGKRYNNIVELLKDNGVSQELIQKVSQLYKDYTASTKNPSMDEFKNILKQKLSESKQQSVSIKPVPPLKYSTYVGNLKDGKFTSSDILPLEMFFAVDAAGNLSYVGTLDDMKRLGDINSPAIKVVGGNVNTARDVVVVNYGEVKKVGNAWQVVKPVEVVFTKDINEAIAESIPDTSTTKTISNTSESIKQKDSTGISKKSVSELFESNPELANAVYEALGF
ncbi:MAG TPA: hypothetical protein PK432_00025, partial [Candidatus Dojkabacteria bacterium]|nr:hypothetical protein [Candidatus Dojkabacteria bacterium]